MTRIGQARDERELIVCRQMLQHGSAAFPSYRAPEVLGGAMMDGGAAIPVASVAAAEGSGPQPV
jgi:hypothetical protein